MKPKHKYFRNQRYKNSIERKYNNGYNESYPNNIVFLSMIMAPSIEIYQ